MVKSALQAFEVVDGDASARKRALGFDIEVAGQEPGFVKELRENWDKFEDGSGWGSTGGVSSFLFLYFCFSFVYICSEGFELCTLWVWRVGNKLIFVCSGLVHGRMWMILGWVRSRAQKNLLNGVKAGRNRGGSRRRDIRVGRRCRVVLDLYEGNLWWWLRRGMQ